MESIPARAVADIRFDETVDVVVVGLGVAGSSAVVGARQSDADVLAVERAVAPGGTSANSGGLIYRGGARAGRRRGPHRRLLRGLAGPLRVAGLHRRAVPGRLLRRTEPGVSR